MGAPPNATRLEPAERARGLASEGARIGAPAGTRERLLDAAEALFSEKGIQATSLRDITGLARANLAAVNYHFGSKDSLVREVFKRHLDPLNAERIALLDGAEARAKGKPLPLETILHALFDPTIALWADHPDFMRILGRLQFEADGDLHAFYLSRFGEVVARFKAAVTRALPRVPLRELFWRMHFIFGAMVQTWTCGSDLEAISDGLCTLKPYQKTVDRLVAFGVAALKGPYPGKARNPRAKVPGVHATRLRPKRASAQRRVTP